MVVQSKYREKITELPKIFGRINQAQEQINQIRSGKIDAFIINNQVYTLSNTEHIYKVFVETMREGAVSLSADNKILYCNNRFSEMLGKTPEMLINTGIVDYCPDEYKPKFLKMLEQARSGESTANLRLLTETNTHLPVKITLSAARHPDMALTMIVTDLSNLDKTINSLQDEVAKRMETQQQLKTAHDQLESRVEERTKELEKANIALIESQHRYKQLACRLKLALSAANAGTWDWQIKSDRFTWSEEFFSLLGYLPGAIEPGYQNWLRCVHPQDRTRFEQTLKSAIHSQTELDLEFRITRPDGQVRWLAATGRVFGVSSSAHVIGLLMDITQRKAVQEQLFELNEKLEQQVFERTQVAQQRLEQLQQLTVELTQAEQRERRRFAQLVHDHIQQLLAAAKVKVGMIRSQLSEKPVRDMLGQVHDLLHQSISATRSLAVQLSPPCLYESGLANAMEWLCEWMTEKHGLTVTFQAHEKFKDITEEVRVLLFQVVRELLFNIVKHAGTSQACLEIHRDSDLVLIIVSDQGAGFDSSRLQKARRHNDGFGLLSIRERIESIGGCFEVQSAKGKGTTVRIFAPACICQPDNLASQQPCIEQAQKSDQTGWLWPVHSK